MHKNILEILQLPSWYPHLLYEHDTNYVFIQLHPPPFSPCPHQQNPHRESSYSIFMFICLVNLKGQFWSQNRLNCSFLFMLTLHLFIHLDTLGTVVGPIHAFVWSFINLLRDSCSWLAAALKNVVSSFFKSSTFHRDLGLWPSNTLHSLSSPLLDIFISIHQYFKLACIIKCKVKKKK